MNTFDATIMSFLNHFPRHSWTLDTLLSFLSANHLLKGGLLVTIIWWLLFKNDESHPRNREYLISTLISCIVAVALARGLALTLPFRVRPLDQGALKLILPHGVLPSDLTHWSSYPSDHAVLFFALSTGLLFVSGRGGAVALTYTLLFICLPRVYLGIHYPSDIIGGAIIGSAIAVLSSVCLVKHGLLRPIVNWSYAKPGLFFPLVFLLTYQIAELFDSSRAIVSIVLEVLRRILA